MTNPPTDPSVLAGLRRALPEIIDWLEVETLVYKTEHRTGNAAFAEKVVALFKAYLSEAALSPVPVVLDEKELQALWDQMMHDPAVPAHGIVFAFARAAMSRAVAVAGAGGEKPIGKRLFLPDDATPEQIAEYDAAYRREHAENDALMAAEKLLTAHGYNVSFDHATPEPSAALRDGWVMVPKEPTPEIVKAINNFYDNGYWNQEETFGHGVYTIALASAPPVPGDGWMDISTAPKDGTWVQVYRENCTLEDSIVTARWFEYRPGHFLWQNHDDNNNPEDDDVTHWRELPPPPQPAKGEDK